MHDKIHISFIIVQMKQTINLAEKPLIYTVETGKGLERDYSPITQTKMQGQRILIILSMQ